jgi:uncharacterized protein
MRVLLDANILISFLLSSRETSPIVKVVRAAVTGRYTLLLHEQILFEVTGKVAAKSYLVERITQAEVEALFNLLREVATTIPTIAEEIPPVTRDPKDDYLLAYAMVGQADYLVTGDEDLLALKEVGSLQIVTPRQFADLL